MHVAGIMYSVFSQKVNISKCTIHELSIGIQKNIREFALYANRCINLKVDF